MTSRRGQCPSKFTCQLAKSGGLFYCCPVSPHECSNGRKAYTAPGSSFPQTCSMNFNSCPPGYSCHPSADGASTFCCLDLAAAAECPEGASPYLYANRPLACPAGSTRCPSGYSCVRSTVYSVHLCCSVSFSPMPLCTGGIAYIDPISSEPQSCSPLMNNCPPGYQCQESSAVGHYLCCTSGHLNTRYSGYCPIGQIPYVRYANEEPRICHMTLRPCPVTAQYMCIYTEDVFGCPVGSRPLMDQSNRIQGCNPGMCPMMYSCHYSTQYSRYQCCSSMTASISMSPAMADIGDASQCDVGSAKIKGRCMRLLYLGQKGCEENEQCSMRLAESRCERGYCVCPRHKLIHQSKCVTHCPEGFIDIAARCRDLTTIVFMDSVDERANGTIGGFCKGTVIAEEQCDIVNSYCNEKSVTCQCEPGYELSIEFSNPNDTVSTTASKQS
ncbi:unnamed protein product [Gongylonema pulchrum]|uniref:EB domain-containing protein n=1 Tax=Gongylonema pulchrum TaxID=637853 RepID=A0A3P6PCW5_9BILA|nr:unnamed protein product [Gongylonema pulchrum]